MRNTILSYLRARGRFANCTRLQTKPLIGRSIERGDRTVGTASTNERMKRDAG